MGRIKIFFIRGITLVGSFIFVATGFAGPEPLPSGKETKEVAPAPLPECSWSGLYFGLHAGGQFGHSENRDLNGWNFGIGVRDWGYSESGFNGGGQIGYNFQWHWIVLGPEFDIGYLNLDGRGQEIDIPGTADSHGESDSDFYTTLRGRLGVAFDWHGCWLVYGTGGAIGVNYATHFQDTGAAQPPTPSTIDARKTDFNWGYTVGGGIERQLGRHWSIKGEYLYFSLDEQEFSATGRTFAGASVGQFRFNGETTGHIVRAGLNFRF